MAAPCREPVTRTSSRCAPETVRGTHSFEISGYSMHKGMGAGKSLRSTAFTVGGYQWCVRYYPDGLVGEQYKGYLAVFLELLSQKSEVRACYQIRMVEQLSRLSRPLAGAMSAPMLFSTVDMSKNMSSWGVANTIHINLVELYCVHRDCLVVQCDVTIVKPPSVARDTLATKAPIPPPDIAKHFLRLLQNEEGTDVTFTVKGEVFRAHRTILAARSPVFKAQLFGPVGENNRQSITIEDMEPTVFQVLLEFMYTDSSPPAMKQIDVNDTMEVVKHLLVAADRYAFERLKPICEAILCRHLRVQTVTSTLSLADQYDCRILKEACVELINSPGTVDAVKTTQGYDNLKRVCPSVFIDMWEKATKHPKN